MGFLFLLFFFPDFVAGPSSSLSVWTSINAAKKSAPLARSNDGMFFAGVVVFFVFVVVFAADADFRRLVVGFLTRCR